MPFDVFTTLIFIGIFRYQLWRKILKGSPVSTILGFMFIWIQNLFNCWTVNNMHKDWTVSSCLTSGRTVVQLVRDFMLPRCPSRTDPDVAGTSPIKEKDDGVLAARLLPVGDTDDSAGTGTSTWYFLRARGIHQTQIETQC